MSVKEVDPKLCFSFSVCSTESKNELIKISKQHLKWIHLQVTKQKLRQKNDSLVESKVFFVLPSLLSTRAYNIRPNFFLTQPSSRQFTMKSSPFTMSGLQTFLTVFLLLVTSQDNSSRRRLPLWQVTLFFRGRTVTSSNGSSKLTRFGRRPDVFPSRQQNASVSLGFRRAGCLHPKKSQRRLSRAALMYTGILGLILMLVLKTSLS